jgi:hypothetical protein
MNKILLISVILGILVFSAGGVLALPQDITDVTAEVIDFVSIDVTDSIDYGQIARTQVGATKTFSIDASASTVDVSVSSWVQAGSPSVFEWIVYDFAQDGTFETSIGTTGTPGNTLGTVTMGTSKSVDTRIDLTTNPTVIGTYSGVVEFLAVSI